MSSLNKLSEAVVDTVAMTVMMMGVMVMAMTAVMMGVMAMTTGMTIKTDTITSMAIRGATNTTEFD
jgi:hypothetical protein